jgi:AhpD family alkylhydroperoxidase
MQMRVDYRKSVPRVLAAMRTLQEGIDGSGLEPGLLELVKIRASQINGCAFCLDMHTREARKRGEDEQRIYQLDAWRDSPLYTPRERAALGWTEAVTLISPQSVTDAPYDETCRYFNEQELAYLTLAVIAINGWNRLNIAFRTPPAKQDP